MDGIAKMATSTASDHAAIAQLTATVKRLTTELVTMNTKLVAALQTQQAIQVGKRERSRGRRRGESANAGARPTTPTNGPPTGAGTATRTNKQDLDPPIHYYWTYVPGCRHNSAKFPAPATGHIYTATNRDIQGRAEVQK